MSISRHESSICQVSAGGSPTHRGGLPRMRSTPNFYFSKAPAEAQGRQRGRAERRRRPGRLHRTRASSSGARSSYARSSTKKIEAYEREPPTAPQGQVERARREGRAARGGRARTRGAERSSSRSATSRSRRCARSSQPSGRPSLQSRRRSRSAGKDVDARATKLKSARSDKTNEAAELAAQAATLAKQEQQLEERTRSARRRGSATHRVRRGDRGATLRGRGRRRGRCAGRFRAGRAACRSRRARA